MREVTTSRWMERHILVDGIQPDFPSSLVGKILLAPGSALLELLLFGGKADSLQDTIDDIEGDSSEPEFSRGLRNPLCGLRGEGVEFDGVGLWYAMMREAQKTKSGRRTQTKVS